MISAESAILSTVVLKNECFDTLATLMREDDFISEPHRSIYSSMLALRERGVPLDPVTLEAELSRRLGAIPSGFNQAISAPVIVDNLEAYVEQAKVNSLGRQLVVFATAVIARSEGTRGLDLLGYAERELSQISDRDRRSSVVRLDDGIDSAIERLELRQKGTRKGIQTGYRDLDDLTAGLQGSELIIVGARPGVGKTALACNLALAVSLADRPVLFFSLEQSVGDLVERMLCAHYGIDSMLMRSGTLTDWHWDLMTSDKRMRDAKVYIDAEPKQTIFSIASTSRFYKRQHSIALIVIDYLQMVRVDARLSREQQVSAVSRSLKTLARELDTPVLALAQLNRATEEASDHRPQLHQLRESGGIEADADVVMLLHRPGLYDRDAGPETELIVAKQRNGPIGTVHLFYDEKCLRFQNTRPNTLI